MIPRLVAAVLAATTITAAADDVAPDTAEAGSIEAIRAATTEARFLSPWVSYLPE